MEYIYHYTSKENWKKIRKIGKLIPRTTIQWVYSPQDFTSRAKSICPFKKYTVGFPSIRHSGWVEYGLWDEIFRLIKCEVLLKIKIPENSKGFIREHIFCSPKGMKDKYDEDVYNLGYSGKISVNDSRIKKSLIAYWNSAVPISKYENNFIAPEIWIPEEIPLASIEEIPFQK